MFGGGDFGRHAQSAASFTHVGERFSVRATPCRADPGVSAWGRKRAAQFRSAISCVSAPKPSSVSAIVVQFRLRFARCPGSTEACCQHFWRCAGRLAASAPSWIQAASHRFVVAVFELSSEVLTRRDGDHADRDRRAATPPSDVTRWSISFNCRRGASGNRRDAERIPVDRFNTPTASGRTST